MSSSTSSASSAKEEENDRRASLELSSSSTSSFKDGEEDDSIFSTRDEFTEDTSVDLSEMDDFDETDVLDELSISSSNLGEDSDLLPSSADSNKQLLRRRRRSRENMASNQQDLLLLDRGGKDHPQLQSLPNQKTVPPSPLANRKEMSPERLNEMRAKVLSELLATEESYIEDLEVVTKYYLPPLKVILTDKEVGMIFSNIVQILAVNQTIHSALKLRIKECKPELLHQCLVADIFLDNADYLKLYSSYTINQPEAFAMITEKKKSHPTFATFVEEMQKHPVSHNLDFKSFLIKPVQRICKYPLLLRELLRYTAEDHPEYEDLAAAYQKVESVAHHVEKHNNRAENVSKMIEIQRSVTGLGKITIVQPQRTFLMEDDFVKLSSKKRRSNYPLHLFLFNDALMATKAVKKEGSSSGNSGGGSSGGNGGGGKEKYAFKGMMPIKTIIVRDMEDTSAYKYAFELIEVRTEEKRKNTAVKLSVASAENIKLKWLKAIHDAKKAIQRGTLLTTVGGLQGRRRGDKRPRSTSSLPADILAQLKASSPSSPLGLSALGSSSIPAPSDSASSSPLSSSGSLSLSALEDENGSECLTSYIDLNVLKGEMEKERERAEKERSLQAASAASGKQTPTKNVSIAAEALQEEGSNSSSSSTSSLSPVLSKKSSNRKGQLKHTISLSALPKLKKDSLDGTKHLRESSGNPSSKNSLSSSTSSSGQKQAVKKKAVVVRALHDPLCDGGGGPHPPPPPPPQQQDSSLRIPPRSPGRRNAAGGSGNNVVAGGGGGTAAALRKGSLPPMRLGSTNLNNKVMFGPPTQAAVTEAFQKLRPVASAHNFPRPSSSSPSQQSAPTTTTTTTTTTKVSIPGGATLRPGKGGLSHAFLPPPPPPASLPTSSSSESLSLSSLNNSNNKGVNMNSFANSKPPPPLNLPLPGSNNLPPPLTIPPQPPLSSSTPLPLPLSLPLSSPTSTSSLSNNNMVARVISGRDTLKKKQEQDNETEHLHHRQSTPNTHTADASNNNSKHAVLLPMMIRRRKEMSETALAETRWTAMLSPRGTPSSSFFQQQMQKRGMEEREEQEAAAALNSARSQLRAKEELRKRLKEIQYQLFALEHDNKQQTSYYVEDDEEEEYVEEEEQDEEIDPLLMGTSNEPYRRRRRESINRGRRSTIEKEEDMISSGSSSSSSTPTSSAPPSPLSSSSSTTPKGRKELEQALKKQVEEKNRWKRKYKQLKAKYRETSSTVK